MDNEMNKIKKFNKELRKQGLKKCSTCLQIKKLDEFYFYAKPKSDARQYMCQECAKLYYREKWKKADNREKILRKKRHNKWYGNIKKQIFKAYGGKCQCCGETRLEFLTVDHINGGGTKHRKKLGGGREFFLWLRDNNYPQKEYRLLCWNCNMSRGAYGYCPHERE